MLFLVKSFKNLRKKGFVKLRGDRSDLSGVSQMEKKIKIYSIRLRVLNYFLKTKSRPEWLSIRYLPVLPVNLRPFVRFSDDTLAISELNSLYSDILRINNHLLNLRKLFVSEKFLKKEKLSLQEAVNKLINKSSSKNSFLVMRSKKNGIFNNLMLNKIKFFILLYK